VGRTDIVDFPELSLFEIPVKIDTGAFTSSFHCHSIIEEDGVLKCQFLDPKHDKFHGKRSVFHSYSTKNVKSSNGLSELRYLIKTKVLVFKKLYSIELTLTERRSMRYPVLLGRKFLSNKFIIDSTKSNLSATDNKIKLHLK
jgi:hypothetical protein